MKILNSQIQKIHALLPAGIKNDASQKANLVQQYTGDWNKTSTKDLTLDQANDIIKRFGGTPIQYENWAYFDVKKASHRNILSLCIQAGWEVFNVKRNENVADLYRLSEWLKSKRSPVQKPLQKMDNLETNKIIYALKSIAS